MKKLLLLLLIPTLSYSQITFKNIMSINSENTFKRVMIENGYELLSKDNKNLIYDLPSLSLGGFDLKTSVFVFTFFRDGRKFYDSIVDDIKESCTFLGLREYDDFDFVCYSCSESKYKGDIGFMVSEKIGQIKHFPKEE